MLCICSWAAALEEEVVAWCCMLGVEEGVYADG